MTDIPFQVEVGATPGTTQLEYERPRDGRVRLTVRLGQRPTGGHSITVKRITRHGPRLQIECIVGRPAPRAMVTQVLTSPMQTVSVAEEGLRGVREAVLVDQTGAELARTSA